MNNLKPRSAAKLSVEQVQHIRSLSWYFTTRSIASAFGVCSKTISNLIWNRSWCWLADDDVPLPLVPFDKARQLKLKAMRGLAPTERIKLVSYAEGIVMDMDLTGIPRSTNVDAEWTMRHVDELWTAWQPIRYGKPRGKRRKQCPQTGASDPICAGVGA
jgi:hypothetical protein